MVKYAAFVAMQSDWLAKMICRGCFVAAMLVVQADPCCMHAVVLGARGSRKERHGHNESCGASMLGV